MFRNYRPVWEEVNLDNLTYNIGQIKSKVGHKRLIGVVKADAYGHGAFEVSQVLLENGVERLAVAVLDEAVELRQKGIKSPIMVLGIIPHTLIGDILDYDVETIAPSYEYACKLSKAAVDKGKTAKIHIAVDTGMGRIGFLINDDSVDEIYKISQLPNIEIQSLFSHFSTADELDKTYSQEQFEKYKLFYDKLMEKKIKINMRDIANSAAIMELPDTYCDSVRPGIIIYGYYPSNEVDKNELNIKPLMTLKASVVHVKTLEAGQYVGYGRKFQSKRKSVIATLPIGYADGYTRMLFGKAKVIINGKFAPVVGNICMDQCMVDVTDAGEVNVGDEVVLIGEKDGLRFNAEDIAKILGTISYEVLCMMSKRIPRVYIKNGEVIKVKNYLIR
ncbi:alanine racemase [Clostridium luticellarii]|jgi:alanine racemase|uniref:Alanine racemase n=1 Tax=Clostridium luticellarii TaxID=1691940 RepID=A0A2T0BR78_9CLOT|nr:alanine racemase [Clostridium luticellarii]MCI1944532.1 alanine racemase [Clostridium luticellarii]MCI1968031.1 alanine racemase [Clostridium luticellarii]MCI1995577.1 alanine racemase [Clostridium luticellarii]MCI2039911.1 alanine racemase [Clostridium luticellarii]PRR86355.1 Alanine racemase [Clostridium luticellarii]